jgi:hypothetical protein
MAILDRIDVLCRAVVLVWAWSGIAALLHRWGWISLTAAIVVVAPAFTIGHGPEPGDLLHMVAVVSPTAAHDLPSPARWLHVGLTAGVAVSTWVALIRRDGRADERLMTQPPVVPQWVAVTRDNRTQ